MERTIKCEYAAPFEIMPKHVMDHMKVTRPKIS